MSTLAVNNVTEVGGAPVVTSGVLDSGSLPTGSVLQVVSTTKTDSFSASITNGSTWTAITGLSVNITPSSTSSKILVRATVASGTSSNHVGQIFRLERDASAIGVADSAGNRPQASNGSQGGSDAQEGDSLSSVAMEYLDSPSSTSALTYSVSMALNTNTTNTGYVNRTRNDADVVYNERAVSTITVMEIAG